MLNTCLGFVPNLEDAEDICQEAFIEIYRSIHNFRGEARLSTWVYRVTVAKSLDHLKAKKRKKRCAQVISLDRISLKPMNLFDDDFNHPGVALEQKERTKLLFDEIGKLPENQKIACILNKIEGLSYKEVAQIMELSKSSVESLLFRAKGNLKKYLRAHFQKGTISKRMKVPK